MSLNVTLGPSGVICSVYEMRVSDGAGAGMICRIGVVGGDVAAGSIWRRDRVGTVVGRTPRTWTCDVGGSRTRGRGWRIAGWIG